MSSPSLLFSNEIMENEIKIRELDHLAFHYMRKRDFKNEDKIQLKINELLRKRYFYKIFGEKLPTIIRGIQGNINCEINV
ncbi:hypothetical protein [Nitrosopumilus sp.]|uniref:hypothetical protein n=1 Tax=Nitrosopumilus sp. TaxID=2024843 RepID=UPI003D0A59A5